VQPALPNPECRKRLSLSSVANPFTRQTGASLRSSLLVDFLRRTAGGSRAYLVGQHDHAAADGRYCIRTSHFRLAPLAIRLYVAAASGTGRAPQVVLFLHGTGAGRSFKRALNVCSAHADAAFVSTPSLPPSCSPSPAPVCIPLFVTAHDVLATKFPTALALKLSSSKSNSKAGRFGSVSAADAILSGRWRVDRRGRTRTRPDPPEADGKPYRPSGSRQ
jgi:hypothetical protein